MGRQPARWRKLVCRPHHVLPETVPLRQWVLTFPFELRARLGFDGKLLSEVSGVVNAALLSFCERALRDHVARCPSPDAGGAKRKRAKLQSGTVTVVQQLKLVRSPISLPVRRHIHALDVTKCYTRLGLLQPGEHKVWLNASLVWRMIAWSS